MGIFFYRENLLAGPERPSDSARYIFDASDISSITTTTHNGVPNKVISWASTGINTSSATPGAGNTTNAPIYEATSNSIRYFSGSNIAYYMRLGTTAPNLSTPNWHMFAIVNPANITRSDVNAYSNHQIFAFAQYGGIYLALSGTTRVAQAHVYDGTHKTISAAGVNLNTKILVEGKATGTSVSVAVNGGTFVSRAAGNTLLSSGWKTEIAGNWSGAGSLSGSIHEIVVFSDDLADDRRVLWTDYLKAKWSI
jgi:hypothetical protein